MGAVAFPEPRRAVRDALRALLAGRSETYAQGVTVSTKFPDPLDAGGARPWVRVALDGSFRDSRLNGRASMRFQVWHADEGLTVDLALLAEALLLDASTDLVRGFSALGGPIPSSDPDTGEPLSFFTLTARLRPRQLT